MGKIVTVSLLRLKNLRRSVYIGKAILKSCNLVHIEKNIFEKAWTIFSDQRQRLSFVDCTTIAAMQEMKIRQIATFDGDFAEISHIQVLD